jgi:hypothetical protein
MRPITLQYSGTFPLAAIMRADVMVVSGTDNLPKLAQAMASSACASAVHA